MASDKSVETTIKKQIADTISINTKVPLKHNHIESFEQIGRAHV